MADKLAKPAQKAALTLVVCQALLVIVISLLYVLLLDIKAGYSALMGGGIYVIPNLLFSWLAFQVAGASKSKLVVLYLYGGEAAKLLLTIGLFVIALAWMDLALLPLYLCFAIALFSQWLSPFFFSKHYRTKNG